MKKFIEWLGAVLGLTGIKCGLGELKAAIKGSPPLNQEAPKSSPFMTVNF